MPESKREIALPWSEKKWTPEEQREINEYDKNHIDHPEFYSDYNEDNDNKEEHS